MHPLRQIKTRQQPLLMVDIDGVISLFGFSAEQRPLGGFHAIEGIPHFISAVAAEQLEILAGHFDLVWASGWEERANEHLPALLGLAGHLPFLRFDRAERSPRRGRAGRAGAAGSLAGHWKLAAIDEHAGERPLAWVDDVLDEHCERWAAQRSAPTLLMRTEPAVGLTDAQTQVLIAWARTLG